MSSWTLTLRTRLSIVLLSKNITAEERAHGDWNHWHPIDRSRSHLSVGSRLVGTQTCPLTYAESCSMLRLAHYHYAVTYLESKVAVHMKDESR